jgi:putative peptidoglycan lipid II flippase
VNETPDSRQRHIARNVLLVSGLFALAAAAGLFRNMIIGRTFGIGAGLDAYYAAFKLPDLLFTIVAGGALATAFIPVFADFLAEDDRRDAWRLAAAITNWVVLIVGLLAIIAALIAPWLVSTVIAPGFSPEAQAQTVTVMRIVLISTVVFGISAVQGSVLQGFKHFLLPALAAVVYPLAIAAAALWLAPRWGIVGLAVGAVIGSVLHLAVKVPGLIRYGFRWWPILHASRGAVKRVAYLMGPRVLDLALFHVTLLATTNLASRLGAGSVSSLEWGWDAMQLPETIIGTAFGLVAFPTLAELAARHDTGGLRRTLSESLRVVLALAVPAAAGLLLLGRPLLALLYQRGEFDAAVTNAVYTALRFYALGLAGHACLELAARAYFALQDTITPLLIAALSAATNIGLSLILMRPLGYGGLALANSLAVTGEVLLLLFVLRGRIGGVEGRALAGSLARTLAATAVMSAVILVTSSIAARAGLGNLMTLAECGVAGAATYLLMAWVLRIDTLFSFIRALGIPLPVLRRA